MSINNYSTAHQVTVLQVCEGEGDATAQAAAQATAQAAAQAATTQAADQAAAIQVKIDAAVAEATRGLKAKNDQLLAQEVKLKEKTKAFEGLDPVELQALKARLDADDDSKLLAEGKKNLVIEKYTERMRAQHQSELKALQDSIKAANERADSYRSSVLDNQIRAVTGELHKGAVEDALLYARTIFTLDAKGNAVQLAPDGNPVLGKDGVNPFSLTEWMEMQKNLKPHWFPASTTGSGASATRDASGTGKAIKRADFDKLSGLDQVNAVRNGVKIVD